MGNVANQVAIANLDCVLEVHANGFRDVMYLHRSTTMENVVEIVEMIAGRDCATMVNVNKKVVLPIIAILVLVVDHLMPVATPVRIVVEVATLVTARFMLRVIVVDAFATIIVAKRVNVAQPSTIVVVDVSTTSVPRLTAVIQTNGELVMEKDLETIVVAIPTIAKVRAKTECALQRILATVR